MNRAVFISVLAIVVLAAARPDRAEQRVTRYATLNAAAPQSNTSLPSEFQLLSTRYRFENDGTGRREVIARIRVLDDRGVLQRSKMTFEYHPRSEDLQIAYFRVKKKDGSVVSVETDTPQPNGPLNQSVPEFDHRERQIRIPELAPGDLIEYDVLTAIRRPIGPHEFYVEHSFQPSGVLDEELAIDIPADRQVKVKSTRIVQSWKTLDGGRRVYHWQYKNPDASRVLLTPYVPARPPDVQASSFQSWEEVGRWYEDLEKHHRAPTQEVKAKADELTQGLSSDIEKVESLYNFAAKKIRYVTLVSLGIGGYEPRSADETIHNGYGDCKDKVALLAALLEAEGMHPSSVLISPFRQVDQDLPSPWPFTHVVTMLHLGKEEIWMDPSSEVLPFRMLVYLIRGKQGLVIPPNGTPHFEETPAEAPLSNTWSEEIQGKIAEDGSLDAAVKITARGDAELSIRQAFIGPIEAVWPMTVQGAVRGINRTTDKVSDVKISDPIDTDHPFTLSFRLLMPYFADVTKARIRFKMPLANFDVPSSGEEGVVDAAGGWHRGESEPVSLGLSGARDYKLKLALPSGFYAESREPIAIKSRGVEYNAIYSRNESSLTAARRFIITTDHLPAKFRAEYADFRRKVLLDMDRRLSAKWAGVDIDEK